jgi:hypothetical protein
VRDLAEAQLVELAGHVAEVLGDVSGLRLPPPLLTVESRDRVLPELGIPMRKTDALVAFGTQQCEQRFVERPLAYVIKKGGDGVVEQGAPHAFVA